MNHQIVGLTLFLSFAAHAAPIGTVQGAGEASPLAGQTVTVSGTVTGDFQQPDQLGGFFLQDAGDGDEATSDGIFIYAPLTANGTDVQAGQSVTVTGKVAEFSGQTQIAQPKIVVNTARLQPAAPLKLRWPLPREISAERHEGMLVTLPQVMTVAGNHELDRFGTLLLSAEGRPFTPGTIGGTPAELKTLSDATLRRMLSLDDGSARRSPTPPPYLNAQGTRRAGDTVANLTGILSEGWQAYRLHPTVPPVFTESNPRPAAPPAVGGNLKIATFNLHNYFTTLRRKDNEARGAASPEEFARQNAKLLAAIVAINPDVLACMELENNRDGAVLELLKRLNAATGNAYAAAPEPAGGMGMDAIRVAIFYKPARLTPRGAAHSDIAPIFDRPPLAQTFATPGGAVFTVVVNHFKSKGSCPATGDVDEGEGCWTKRRTAQAKQLLSFVDALKKSSGSPLILALGDFNAYLNETPLRTLKAGGLVLAKGAADAYSFVYDGRAGALDHAFSSPELAAKVMGCAEWHINADEPDVLDYSVNKSLAADFYRCSDHDPMLLGLELK